MKLVRKRMIASAPSIPSPLARLSPMACMMEEAAVALNDYDGFAGEKTFPSSLTGLGETCNPTLARNCRAIVRNPSGMDFEETTTRFIRYVFIDMNPWPSGSTPT